jgi:hypothetical protein
MFRACNFTMFLVWKKNFLSSESLYKNVCEKNMPNSPASTCGQWIFIKGGAVLTKNKKYNISTDFFHFS